MSGITLQATPWAWLALVSGVIAATYVVASYSRSGQVAGHRFRFILMGIRLLSVLTLVIAAFQPTIRYEQDKNARRSIAILVDSSRSMGVVDHGQTPTEQVRLAEACGLAKRPEMSQEAEILIEELKNTIAALESIQRDTDEAEYARLAGRSIEQAMAGIKHRTEEQFTSLKSLRQQLGVSEIFRPLLKRMDDILKILTENENNSESLRRNCRALLREMNHRLAESDGALIGKDKEIDKAVQTISGYSRLELSAHVLTNSGMQALRDGFDTSMYTFADNVVPTDDAMILKSTANGPSTDLYTALDRILARYPPETLAGVILVSDGRSTESRPRLSASSTASGVPVFVVPAGVASTGPDVRISRAIAPSAALVNEMFTVRAEIRSTQLSGKQVKVVLEGAGDKQEKTVALSDDVPPSVEFFVKCTDPGNRVLKVNVAPQSGEVVTSNNTADVSVRVLDQKIKVAMLSGSSAWDTQYLRNALARSQWVELTEVSVADHQSAVIKPETLLQQQVIVLADVPIECLSVAQVEAINRLVTHQNGGVLFLPAESSIWRGYAQNPLLSILLPFKSATEPKWQTWPGEQANVQAVPTQNVGNIDFLKLADSPDDSMRSWLLRPRFFRLLRMSELKPTARALLMDRESSQPLLVETSCGAGLTLFMAFDESWRWRKTIGGQVHDQFLLQLIRHVVEKPYDIIKDKLAIAAERQTVAPDQPFEVRARYTPDNSLPPPETLQLVVRRGDEVLDTRQMSQTLPGSGRYNASVTLSTVGPVDLELATSDESSKITLPIHVETPSDREMADVSADPQALGRIAEATGGAVVGMDRLSTLYDQIHNRSLVRSGTIEYALWCSPYLFSLLIGLLGLEWALRKYRGMV